MNLDELPLVGRLFGAVGALGEILLNGGDLVLDLAMVALLQLDQLIPFLLTLERFAARVPGVPENAVQHLVTAALVASLTLYVVRRVDSIRGSET